MRKMTLRDRAPTCRGVLVCATFLSGLCSSVGSFRVTVPEGRMVAIRGHPVVLGCEFTPEPSSDISNLVVTWQRQEDSRVVHSFYYQKDQLENQNADYCNRTALFATELWKGNASLRIVEVGPKDVGRYQCMVSTSSGTDRAELQLDYGALYTDPRLSISFSTTKVMVQYEAEGFPKPEVRWLDEMGQNLSHNTECSRGDDGEVDLYYLKSSYEAHTPTLKITFILKNQLLNQDLQRLINLSYTDDSSHGTLVTLAVLCVLLIIVVIVFTWLYWHKRK